MYLTSVEFMNSCQSLDISTAWETGRDLLYRNLDEELLVPEDDDIPLSGRVGHISAHCLTLGKKNVIVASIHVNAAVKARNGLMRPDGVCSRVQGRLSRIDWLNVCVSRLSRTFLVVVSEQICQMEIWTGRKGFIFFVSPGVLLC